MSFVPAVPFGGAAGWAFLQRTRPAQQQAFEQAPRLTREVETFSARIADIRSAGDLAADRQLLGVALGAFGLGADLENRFFIRTILESDTRDPGSLARRLADKRYLAFARAFGFGDAGGPRTGDAGFARRITDLYLDRGFEAAVGEQDPGMRLAMGLERDLGDVASRASLSRDGKWFTVFATPPLRAVFETALGLPESIGTLDLDRQLAEFRDRAQGSFGVGEVAEFDTPDMREKLTDAFLARSQIEDALQAARTRGSVALALLQAGQG